MNPCLNPFLRTILIITLPAYFLLVSAHAFGTHFVNTASGNWKDSLIWLDKKVPKATINAGDTVTIQYTVNYNLGSDLEIKGTLVIQSGVFSTPEGSGRSVFIRSTGALKIYNGTFRLPIFNSSGGAQSGSLVNEGGYLLIEYSNVEIAQNWTALSGARSKYVNGCLSLGQNYLIDAGSIDSNINNIIRLGLHASGNFNISGSSTVYFANSEVLFRGTSGNFNNYSGGSVIGGAGSIKALSVPGSLTNDGTWQSQVINYCIGSSINGINAAQVNANLPPIEDCAAANQNATTSCNAMALLDVKFSSFWCEQNDSKIMLKWETSDIDIISFHVQRSYGVGFDNIGAVSPGTGLKNMYTFIDRADLDAVTYYRVCMVDGQGNKHYSNISKVTPQIRSRGLIIYPSLFTTHLNIRLDSPGSKAIAVILTNIQGKEVYRSKTSMDAGASAIILNSLDHLQNGTYFVRIVLKDGTIMGSKVSKL